LAPESHVRSKTTEAGGETQQGTLLVCLFHLNLAYSSLEEEDQGLVVESCYRPLLGLAEETGFPIAIEAAGWTLERIAELDPAWIASFRDLIAEGKVELVGSSWTQCAAPLLPAQVNRWNIRLGREAYAGLLGVTPRIALLSEQAYSTGLASLFADEGYEGIIADWDNAYRSHQDWPASHRRFPQRAAGTRGAIPLIWSQSIAFQRFQRFAHGELSLDEYLSFVRGAVKDGDGALLLYANDAEVFDRRPGRFAAEAPVEHAEWERIAQGLAAVREGGIGIPGLPSGTLGLLDRPQAGHEIQLEAPDQPIPVKKQDKYNIARWGCTGRDDTGINTRCWRIYDRMQADGCEEPAEWRRLCGLWASDFRTHITDNRWKRYLEELEQAERDWGAAPSRKAPALVTTTAREKEGDLYTLKHGEVTVVLNARRGLSIHAFTDAALDDRALFGTIQQGYFDTIDLGADWYSGSLVQEAPLRHKITDLAGTAPELGSLEDGRPAAVGTVATELGDVEKMVILDGDARAVEVRYTLKWKEIPPGSLRLGFVTLEPQVFSAETLWFATNNGGDELKRFEIGASAFDHGLPVSALVSSRQGLGATEGLVLIGDERHALVISVDQAASKPLGLVSHRPARPGHLTRVCFSLAEEDETRTGPIPLSAPRAFSFSVGARPA
jgi:hypothetical protein